MIIILINYGIQKKLNLLYSSKNENKTPNKITKNAQIYKFKSSTNNQCIDINLNNRNKTRPKKKNVEINIFKNEFIYYFLIIK